MSVKKERARLAEEVTRAVIEAPGDTDKPTRRAVCVRAQRRLRGEPTDDALSPAVAEFVDRLVTDAQSASVDGLLSSGLSEDAALEVAVNAAVASCTVRLEQGLRALREHER